jgi:hypothetical protein
MHGQRSFPGSNLTQAGLQPSQGDRKGSSFGEGPGEEKGFPEALYLWFCLPHIFNVVILFCLHVLDISVLSTERALYPSRENMTYSFVKNCGEIHIT